MSDLTYNAPKLGRYRILERLAVGGMAEVFLAYEENPDGIERVVVIKRILPQLARDPNFEQMFMREARIAASIHHQNVVQIYELGSHGGYPFIVMEYVDGVTLRELCRAGRLAGLMLPVGTAIHLIAQACAGAHAAHELLKPNGEPSGLVHRDLSPHNLMVNKQGHLKVLDFGIAKPTSEDGSTRTGVLKGKLKYMSPEQCNQEELDRRSDIFTLAIVLTELLVGEQVFKGSTELEIIQSVLTGNRVKISVLRPDVPFGVITVLEKALSLNPALRFESAEMFKRELLKAAKEGGVNISEELAATTVNELIDEHILARKQAFDRVNTDSIASIESFGEQSIHTISIPANTFWNRWWSQLLYVSIVLGLLTGFGLFAVCGTPEALTPAVSGPPVLIGFAPTKEPGLILSDLEPLRLYLESMTGHPVAFSVADDYESLAESLLKGNLHFASVPPYLYLSMLEPGGQTTALAFHEFDHSRYTSGVLVEVEGRINVEKTGFSGTKVCYTEPLSSTGFILPMAYFIRNGVSPESDLIPIFSGDHFQAVRDLITGLCDIAATNQQSLASANSAGIPTSRLNLVAGTGQTPHDVILASPEVEIEVAETIKTLLLEFDPMQHAGMPRVGEHERLTGFLSIEDNSYDQLRNSVSAIEEFREGRE